MRVIYDSFVNDDHPTLTQISTHMWQGYELPQLKVVVSISRTLSMNYATCFAWSSQWSEVVTIGHSEMKSSKNYAMLNYQVTSQLTDNDMVKDGVKVRAIAIEMFNKEAARYYLSKHKGMEGETA